MTITEPTSILTAIQKEAIFHLWNNEYPAQLAHASMVGLEAYLVALTNQLHYFATDENGRIVGWAFSFERDYERWFAIIVDSGAQRKGVGASLLSKLKENSQLLNGWATDHDRYKRSDGAPYPSPLEFYVKNGFEVSNDIRLETEKLSAVKISWNHVP